MAKHKVILELWVTKVHTIEVEVEADDRSSAERKALSEASGGESWPLTETRDAQYFIGDGREQQNSTFSPFETAN